jgi:bifunctional DNA-binding transcriptional regulator/antitoxin component of YhaV-PrlF toxin-antitoxin module
MRTQVQEHTSTTSELDARIDGGDGVDGHHRYAAERLRLYEHDRRVLPCTRCTLQMPCIVGGMSASGELRVSARGQMSLPATARRRWGLDAGGEVGYLDIGDAVVIVPGGVAKLRRALLDAVSESDWDEARAGLGDADLANQ